LFHISRPEQRLFKMPKSTTSSIWKIWVIWIAKVMTLTRTLVRIAIASSEMWGEQLSSPFPKSEAHVGHDLHQYSSEVSDVIYCNVTRLRIPWQEAHDSPSSSWRWFCPATTIKTVGERSSFSRVYQRHIYAIP
jgi:hypothetical protein